MPSRADLKILAPEGTTFTGASYAARMLWGRARLCRNGKACGKTGE